MKETVPSYYDSFTCIGMQCKNNCCIGWEVDIDDRTRDLYLNTGGPFGDKLKCEMTDDSRFELVNNRCPFLNSDNLCDIYINMGEKGFCTVCREYPRFTESFGTLTERGLSFSCEESARIIFSDSAPMQFITRDSDEEYEDEFDKELFTYLTEARTLITQALQNRRYSIYDRIRAVLHFASGVQQNVNENIYSMTDTPVLEDSGLDFSSAMSKILDICTNFQAMEDAWYNELSNAVLFDTHSESDDCEYTYEHILVYFVFRYFMKAVYDYDVYNKIRLAVFSYLVIRRFNLARLAKNGEIKINDRIETAAIYSKCVEHCRDNLEILNDEFIFGENFIEQLIN